MPVIFPVSPRGTTAWLSSGLNSELKPAGATPADAPWWWEEGMGREAHCGHIRTQGTHSLCPARAEAMSCSRTLGHQDRAGQVGVDVVTLVPDGADLNWGAERHWISCGCPYCSLQEPPRGLDKPAWVPSLPVMNPQCLTITLEMTQLIPQALQDLALAHHSDSALFLPLVTDPFF